MVSKADGSTKSSTSKSLAKSIKGAFSKSSKSSKSKTVEVKPEEPVVAEIINDEARDIPATTNETENPLDASQIVELQEIVNNAVATTLSKVMGEEEETASKKSNKSVLSRLSKKSKAPSVSPEKPSLPPTIAEDEAETKIEKVPTIKEDELNEKEEAEEINKPSAEEEVKDVSTAEAAQPETISPVSESRTVVTDETPKPGFFCFSC